ncbi:TetR/AcrR family transcriptional regulator [Cryptosporangium phraense]|uniref:TetR/AcrR family transcriptional regulator n=1 Tax=Cryptosporangium phraense TaxID=2593070 RepID=A0A545AGC0_9ACTN|nr:TetR/AcrR family transcriptional regulator [Cryptosporangium phraense]TQS40377.1 TetR/AcrR family transcriptional regulator [Cryptosporangium phraense]
MRTNQIERTRSAIVAAARELADSGAEISMPAIAAAARVSEATAYRHFPDLVTLLRAAVMVEDQVAVLRSVVEGDDPVERVGLAAEILGRAVLRRQGAVRMVVASTIAKPSTAPDRPVQRFALIEHALAPWVEKHPDFDVDELVRDLSVVISAESVFTLLDLCRLPPEEAIASLVSTARKIVSAAVS